MKSSLNYYAALHVGKVKTDVIQFTSIQSAIDIITDNAAGKRYAIYVHPGVYTEKVIMEDYVDLIAMGGREETVINFVSTVANEATLTGENSLIKGFTIITDSTGFIGRCVQNAVAGFEVEDCILSVTAPAGTELVFNTTEACAIRGCQIDTAGSGAAGLTLAGAAVVTVDGTTINSATDAIQVTAAGTLTLTDCNIQNLIDQDAGTVNIVRSRVEEVVLGTALCTLTAEMTRFTSTFTTVDAFAHTITCYKCTFSGQNLNNAATGATTIVLRGCDGIATLTNGGIGGTLGLYDCGVETLTTTQGTVVAYGGRINTCGGSTGTSFVWWANSNELRVMSGMMFAHALTASASGDVVHLAKGTFAESNLVAKDGVDLVGEGSTISIIEATDNANPIITVGNNVACTFKGVKVSNLGTGTTVAVAANAAAAALSVQDCEFRGNGAASIITMTTAGAGAPSLAIQGCTFNIGSNAIAVTGAVVAGVSVKGGVFSTCTLVFSTTGANHIFTFDFCDFGAGGVTLTANIPVVTLTNCEDIGVFTHSTVSTVTLNQCRLSGMYTTGAVAAIVNALHTRFAAFTSAGVLGTVSLQGCSGTDFSNTATATVTIEGGNWDTVLQGAAAGTVSISNAVVATELDCGAAGAINAYNCDVTTVDANGGTVTVYGGNLRDVADVTGAIVWWVSRNELKVIAGSVNMKVSDALTAAGTGDSILLGQGTFLESNLVAKTGVSIIGLGFGISVIETLDNANPIITVGNNITCEFHKLKISNTGTGGAIHIEPVGDSDTITLEDCWVINSGAGDAVVASIGGAGLITLNARRCNLGGNAATSIVVLMQTAGAGTLTFNSWDCNFSTSGGATNAAIEASAVVVAAVNIFRATFASCTLALYSTGANHQVYIKESEFASAGINLAANVPYLEMVTCNYVGDITHNTLSQVWIRNSHINGNYTTGAVATMADYLYSCEFDGTITHGGTGPFEIMDCHCTSVANNSTGAMSITHSNLGGSLTQGATVGTITATNSRMGSITTGGTGTIRLQGQCYFTDIAANGGVLTWKIDPNHIKVVAGTANMKVADALALAASGDVIEIYPGTYAESNLTLKAGVNLLGTDPDQCIISVGDAAQAILNAAVTCTISNLKITNGNAGHPAIEVTTGVLTVRNCIVAGTAAGDAIAILAGTLIAYDTTIGAGDIDLSTGVCNLSMYHCRVTTDPVEIGGVSTNVLVFENTDFGGQHVVGNATGSVTLTMRGCTNVGIVSNDGSGTYSIENSALIGVMSEHASSIIRLKNCQYQLVTRTLGAVVDESPECKSSIFHILKRSWDALIANANVATRVAVGGSVTSGGSGQARLRVDNTALDAAGVENNADAAGALDSSWTPDKTPRYCQQISASSFVATTMMFFGLRATPGAAVPAVAEDHAGFIWTGAAFNASSSDGGGVGQVTALTTPSTGVQHQLGIIIFGVSKVEFYVDGSIVATHTTVGVPNAVLDFQEYEISASGGAGTSDITLREGFIQECRV